MGTKEKLRKTLVKKLLSLKCDEIERRSKNVEKNIHSLSIYQYARTVMAYYPLKGEPNFLGMIRKDLSTKRFCFPAIDAQNKKLLPLSIGDLQKDFVKGPYGVMQPDVLHAQAVDFDELDVLLVPGLAFDRKKNRLGRGGGFYDRFLKTLGRHTKKIGVAFDFQILDTLPVSIPHDERVDTVVTDTGCI